MKKSFLLKTLLMTLALVFVFVLSSCDFELDLFNDGGEDGEEYLDVKDLSSIDKDLAKKDPSTGLAFKEGTDKETGSKYYSIIGMGTCTDTVLILPSEYEGLPVTRISNNAFKESAIERVYIPEGITEIAHHAFADCEALQSVKLPDSVKTIGGNAFSGCKSMVTLYIGNSTEKISDEAFADCSKIEVVYLPESLTTLGSGVFSGCRALGKVQFFSKNLTEIPESTFEECITLQEIVFPEGLKTIGSDCFRGCRSIVEMDIPDTVTKVDNRAFFRCTGLKKLVIPASMEEWGNFVTYFCKDLAEINYEGTLAQWNAIKCYPKMEPTDTEQRVVSPNESLSMYLSICAEKVVCTDGEVDIKAVMEENGFKDSADLNPDA
jgi:hypothetical protein